MGKKILKVILWIIIVILIGFVAAYGVLKLYIVPKVAQKLEEKGHTEIAELVEKNVNLKSIQSFGAAFANKEFLSAISKMDKETVASIKDVMDTLEEEYPQEETEEQAEEIVANTNESADGVWKVGDSIHKTNIFKENNPPVVPKPEPVIEKPVPVPKPEPQDKPKSRYEAAYDRIMAHATAQEISDGMSIIAKVDVGFVLNKMSGGLTPQKKSEILAYLRTVLTSGEINRAAQLYRKYSKYL